MDSVELVTPSKHRNRKPQHEPGLPDLVRSIRVHADREDDTPPSTPSKKRAAVVSHLGPTSPSKSTNAPASPQRLPRELPPHLHPCLDAQKRAILAALQDPPDPLDAGMDDEEPLTNLIASQQLSDLLTGTVTRGEGNSCLLLGPRGSGKTRVRRCPFHHPAILSCFSI